MRVLYNIMKNENNFINLILLQNNQEAEIIDISGGENLLTRLQDMGIYIGQKISKISKIGIKGPTVLIINRAQIAIGYGIAQKILVKPL